MIIASQVHCDLCNPNCTKRDSTPASQGTRDFGMSCSDLVAPTADYARSPRLHLRGTVRDLCTQSRMRSRHAACSKRALPSASGRRFSLQEFLPEKKSLKANELANTESLRSPSARR